MQEIDWLNSADGETTSSAEIIPPPPQFTDSQPCSHEQLRPCDAGCSCADVCDSVTGSEDTNDASSTDDRGGSDTDSESVRTHKSESDSSCGAGDSFGAEARMSNLTFDLMHVSGFNSSSCTEWDSDSAGCVQSLLGVSDSVHTSGAVITSQCGLDFDGVGDTDTALDIIRGRVTQMSKLSASPFFKDLIKQTLSDWKTSKPLNEGLIFHHVRHFHLPHILLYCFLFGSDFNMNT